MNNDQSIHFGKAMNRMMMFVSGDGLIGFDRLAFDVIKNKGGLLPATISGVAAIFGGEVKNLPASRSIKVRRILSGGFVTRLKMEAVDMKRREMELAGKN